MHGQNESGVNDRDISACQLRLRAGSAVRMDNTSKARIMHGQTLDRWRSAILNMETPSRISIADIEFLQLLRMQ